MPTLNYRVESAGISILKTVTDEVVNGLLTELDLIEAFAGAVYITSGFQTNSNYSGATGAIRMPGNRCDVEAQFIMDKSQVPWPVDSLYTTPAMGTRDTQKGTFTPVLIDPAAGILIEHRTSACAIELHFSLTFSTFDEAAKTFDTIQNRYKGSLIQAPFELAFSYPVSFGLMKYLTSVHKAKADYKDRPFMDWINAMKKSEISFDVRKSEIDQPDADVALMIRCKQLNNLMQLTMDQREPEPKFIDQLPDTYSLSFVATIQFGRPTLISVNTPISVDNELLPEELFNNVGVEAYYNPYAAGVYQDLTCNEFMRRGYGNYNAAHQLVRIPTYDDWFYSDNKYRYFEYRPLLIAHFTLDGPTTVIDLKDLGDVALHPTVLKILKETKDHLLTYGGLFHLAVYAHDLQLGPELVSVDDDLNVSIRSDRLDRVYHIVLSETTNIIKTDLTNDETLLKYRYFFPMTIERNVQALLDKNFFYTGYENKFLSLLDRLSSANRLKTLLTELIELGEVSKGIYSYTQNVIQLADYLVATESQRDDYVLAEPEDPESEKIHTYYTTTASVDGRSLFTAFIELCLRKDYVQLEEVPNLTIAPSRTIYPYYINQGNYYGFNTPIRIFNYGVSF